MVDIFLLSFYLIVTYQPFVYFSLLLRSKKNILKSNSFDVMQTVFFAFTCKFGLVIKV